MRTRLADKTLPRHIHVIAEPLRPGEPPPTSFTVGSALSDGCAVCGESATQIRDKVRDVTFAFHHRCHDLWRDEANKPIRFR